ncbi:membrane protein insertase YidC [Aerococcus kribbianus]|uniref:Membrane protein insertase YidC n=1 Tax=Aerococcus kribbianus TaxID=2999064 RepID=A0A9X3FPN8_9LACT|nr:MULTISPECIES: membrane protein insertase YidC [unclassified Aerococcus]MCZ0717683.1 membrane protein insertase YidC [Aerococcus sp. YH-aer221]MCZ0725971.1 membrane protein insertase YidC [Aerococcus sp. YH-aer222]
MQNKKKQLPWRLLTLTAITSLVLSGCANPNNPDGIVYRTIGGPIEALIEWLASTFNGNYGIAIILITLLIRLILLPLTLNQLESSTKQSIKMQQYQPYLKEIQERQKNAQTQEEKMEAAMAQQEFMKENNINMLGGMGCLPLLLQLPIITSLYTAIRVSESINSASFLGIPLGEPSTLLGIITILLYFVQSWISVQGMPEEQRKQMSMSMYMMPIMMAMIVFTSPAGLTLYFLVGAFWAIGQSLYTTFIYKPKIKAQVEAELESNPIKVKTKQAQAKDVTNSVKKENTNNKEKQKQINHKNRNQGKQQNNKK